MICSSCFRHMPGMLCAYCSVRNMHVVGAATDTTATTASDTTVAAQGNAGQVKAASWGDLQLLYPFLWPSYAAGKILDPSAEKDPQVRRNQLAAYAKALDTAIQSCTDVPAADRTNWNTFGQQFAVWFNKDVGFLDAKADQDQADAFQDQLHDWQIEIEKYCKTGVPEISRSSPTFTQLGEDLLGTVGRYFDTAKVAFIVGGVVVIVVVWAVGKDNIRKLIAKVA